MKHILVSFTTWEFLRRFLKRFLKNFLKKDGSWGDQGDNVEKEDY
jgi:hypothetical protein